MPYDSAVPWGGVGEIKGVLIKQNEGSWVDLIHCNTYTNMSCKLDKWSKQCLGICIATLQLLFCNLNCSKFLKNTE